MFHIDADKGVHFGESDEGRNFDSEKALGKLADEQSWSRQDLEAIWNGFAGTVPFEALKPVKKFRNRPYGVQQIWKAVQVLVPADEVVPIHKKKPAKVRKARAAKAQSHETNGFRPESKAAQALGMIRREGGAALSELMDTLSWQRHTVRGFISTLGSKHGVKVEAEKDESRGLVYRA